MSGYPMERIKTAFLIILCCAVIGAAVFGIYKIVSTVRWSAREIDYRQQIAASMEYAESKYSMYVTVNNEEPVHIHFSEVAGIHRYLVTTPDNLPPSGVRCGEGHAVIDCGDGSRLEVWDAGRRQMCLEYRSVKGNSYRYLLKYFTDYDGWEFFTRIVSGESIPG